MAPSDRPRAGLTRRALSTGLALAPLLPARSLAQGAAMASANLAMVGEPQSLDPMTSTADLVATIMQHVFEPLYTFDANWTVQPMLAASLPTISPDGKTYTIAIRENVPLHNGRLLDAEDVVASLRRWMEMTPRGRGIAAGLTSLTAKGPHSVEIVLSAVNPALLAHLALPSGFAGIMAKDAIANPLVAFVGTGPYRFKERRPDQFVVLTKHESYASRTEAPSGYAGRRTAGIPELRFIPVPNANTRVEGVLAGQYHFADQLPVESNPRIAKASGAKPVLTMPFGFPYLVLNTKQGPCANLKVRQALQMALSDTELLTAGFGDETFFEATGSHFPKGSPFHSEAGIQAYDKGDAKGAKALLAEAGYDGTPIRILNSKQYDFHNRIAQVMAEELREAGFKVTLDVVDWATLVSRRGDPALWDVYVTHSAFIPEPMVTPPQLGDGAPGWWDTPAKKAALAALNAEIDPVKRGALWGPVQEVIYREVPYIRVGNFAALYGLSARLKGFAPMPWPAFWNVEPA
ncbi:ABC transporter substrate-binding protein [Methylobacterium sp. JK268]